MMGFVVYTNGTWLCNYLADSRVIALNKLFLSFMFVFMESVSNRVNLLEYLLYEFGIIVVNKFLYEGYFPFSPLLLMRSFELTTDGLNTF